MTSETPKSVLFLDELNSMPPLYKEIRQELVQSLAEGIAKIAPKDKQLYFLFTQVEFRE